MLADLAEVLALDGHQVTVLCAERWDVASEDQQVIADEINGVEIKRLVPRRFGYDTEFQAYLSSFGFHYEAWQHM